MGGTTMGLARGKAWPAALGALALVLATAGCGKESEDGPGPSRAVEGSTADGPADTGDFVLVQEEPSADDAGVAQVVDDSEVPQTVVDGLNEQYALPEDITIRLAAEDVDDEGPHFDPGENEIVVPYPYLAADYDIFSGFGYDDDELDDAMVDDLLFTLYHEVGHALIANLDLPVTGREEDAVDELSAVVLTDTWNGGGDILVSAADWFGAMDSERTDAYERSDFADEHSLDAQRYVNLLCLAYGSDPETYDYLVGPDEVPQDRAEGCPEEYEQAASSWDALLAPWVIEAS